MLLFCPLGKFHKGSSSPASCIYPASCSENLHRIHRQLMLTLFLLPCQYPPLSCIKFGSENPGPHKGEAEMGVSASVVQCHGCGRANPVCIPAQHRGSSVSYGFCANSNICSNYMQKHIILLKLDCNNPKHGEKASDFSY